MQGRGARRSFACALALACVPGPQTRRQAYGARGAHRRGSAREVSGDGTLTYKSRAHCSRTLCWAFVLLLLPASTADFNFPLWTVGSNSGTARRVYLTESAAHVCKCAHSRWEEHTRGDC